jgi:hypothetical protein
MNKPDGKTHRLRSNFTPEALTGNSRLLLLRTDGAIRGPLRSTRQAPPSADEQSRAAKIREVRYLTDDRDFPGKNELVISQGGNGDWYVGVTPEGQGCIGKSVRICTSGGASSRVPGLTVAIADAFRALLAAGEGNGVTHN